ncbi:MAG TPA: NUDIX hydrolase [Novosphingobium sp.]|nr:NUDIX hydrolase [Novosphingobium sp.]
MGGERIVQTWREAEEQVVWQGRFITTKQRGNWEYVSRARNIRAAVILAIDEEDHVLLVEQYRVPLRRTCIELPAGLVGDTDAAPDEDPTDAANRELEEETGYRAARMEVVGEFYSSPGMVTESFTLLRAYGLTRVGPGGGVDDEEIVTHRVPLSGISQFVAERRALGDAIDVKLLMLLAPSIIAAKGQPA